MRALLVLVALLLVAASAYAQDDATTTPATNETPDANETSDAGGEAPAAPEPVTFTLVSRNAGGFHWVLEGQTQRNPALTVPAGAEVTINIVNGDGIPHNLAVAGLGKTPTIGNEGDTASLKFTAPASGSIQYVCEIHPADMRGSVRIQSAGGGGNQGGGEQSQEEINGPTVRLGDVAPGVPSECADRQVPAIVAEGLIGTPTVRDYVDRCLNPQAGEEEAVPPPHPADYVIPISWGLIGLGVVGVVWAHRYYKP